MFTHSTRADDVKNEIKNRNVLVKVIESKVGNDSHWLFLLNQLKNPRTVRPVKKLQPEHNRNITWNAEIGAWDYRNVDGKKRGRKKATPFVKKTPTTAPPRDGRMNYYGQDSLDYIGLGFVMKAVDGRSLVQVKSPYIFSRNIASRTSPWIFDRRKNNTGLKAPSLRSTTLEAIGENNDRAQGNPKALDWNEIIASPSLEAVSFLFAPHDEFTCRLNLQLKRALIQKELGQTLPLVIMGKNTPVKEYTLCQQFADAASLFNLSRQATPSIRVFRNQINFLQLILDFNELKKQQMGKENLHTPDASLEKEIGKLILCLYANRNHAYNNTSKLFFQLLNALEFPIKSPLLDECLQSAITDNEQSIAQLLIAKGADINYVPEGKKTSSFALAIELDRRAVVATMANLPAERFKQKTLKQILQGQF